LLLTDVNGLYDRPPSERGAAIIDTYSRAAAALVKVGEKSARGRGGMGAKVNKGNWFVLRADD
jgi:delta-1-pyrroline-5-carboxylate synthetase